MPSLSDIRRLSLADLDQPALQDLVRHGEDLLVERKQELPKPPGFGAAAGSFANTLGGWILLGVRDDGTVEGWEKPERLDLQSHLGAILRAQVDPLPPFVADMREVDGKPIAAVRVFPSIDSPHIVRGSGAVYVRSSKGKEPVDDHRTLLELARRGEEAEASARRRLRELPAIQRVLRAPDSGGLTDPADRDVRFIARAAPLTVTPPLMQWPLTQGAARWCAQFAEVLVPPFNLSGLTLARDGPHLEPYGRAIAARLSQYRDSEQRDAVTVIADSGGVVGVELCRGGRGDEVRPILLQGMLEDEIRPLVTTLAALLYEAEAYGRTAVDLWIARPTKSKIHDQRRETNGDLHVAGELTIPADEEEVAALANARHRELQREIGIVKFEGEPPDGG